MRTNISNLIIGSNSFLGRSISEKLFALGEKVEGVYHLNTDNLFDKIIQTPISKFDILQDVYEVVYLVSAFVPNEHSANIDERLNEVNIMLVKKVSQKFKKARIVYCSTVSVYAEGNEVILEDSCVNPQSSYAASKLGGEEVIKNHNSYAVLRISSMYGKLMKANTFLPKIINQAINNSKIVLFGNGKRKQNYIHVSDVANYAIAAGRIKKNEIFLAVNKESFSNKAIAEMVKESIPGVEITYLGSDESNSYIYDNRITKNNLGTQFERSIKDELIYLISWMKKQY